MSSINPHSVITWLVQYQSFISGFVFIIIYSAEHIIPQRKELIDFKHDLFNLSIGAIGFLVIFLMGFVFNYIINLGTVNHFGLLNQFNLNKYAMVILQFIIIDIYMYWWHRANHQLPVLWYFHKFHHKDDKMGAGTTLRFHPGELFLSVIVKTIIFSLLGLHGWILIAYGIILFTVITFHHSNIYITDKTDFILRAFIASPKMHRIHHSVIPCETNSNYGSVFPYWDKLFKSYTKHPEKPIVFGIEENKT